ncbi:hypothetical protein GCM10027081_07750 [Cupriavidus yeoncheonensis]
MAVRPPYDASERHASFLHRFAALDRIKLMLETMTWHISVMYQIMRNLYSGYVPRNPLADKQAESQALYERIMASKKMEAHGEVEAAHAPMFGLLGGSAMGKSTVVNRILSFLPQIILHDQHNNLLQLVWLKVDCTTKGSINTLLLWIVQEADRVLDSDYEARLSSRPTYGELAAVVLTIFHTHKLGLLVLDEIQNVVLTGTGVSKENFFTGFPNFGGVPIMYVGLHETLHHIPAEMHTTRRMVDDGGTILGVQMTEDEWDDYLGTLVEYQWTKEVAALEEVKETLTNITQRIPGISSRLWQICQARVIEAEAIYEYYL